MRRLLVMNLLGAVVLASAGPIMAQVNTPASPARPAPAYPAPYYGNSPAYPAPYPAPIYVEPPAPPLTSFSFTFSPIHILAGIFEASAEFRVGERLGLSAIGGYGKVKVEGERFSVFEAGAQFRAYLTGTFRRGLHIGAEVLYINVSGDVGSVKGVGEGLAVGPLVGWKTTLDGGFTFEVQGGVEFVAVGAEASDGSRTETESDSRMIPLLNLNLGWSI